MDQLKVNPAFNFLLEILKDDKRIPKSVTQNVGSVTQLIRELEKCSAPDITQLYKDRSGILGKYCTLVSHKAIPKNEESLLQCLRELANFDQRIPRDVYKQTYRKDLREFDQIISDSSLILGEEYQAIRRILRNKLFNELALS